MSTRIDEIDRLFESYKKVLALLEQYQIKAAVSEMWWSCYLGCKILEVLMSLSKDEQYKWVRGNLINRLTTEYLEKYTNKKTNASDIMCGIEDAVRMREEHGGTDSDDVARRDAAKVIVDEAHEILEDAREMMNYAHAAEEDGWEYGYDGRFKAYRTAQAVYDAAYKKYQIAKGALRPAYAIYLCKRHIGRCDSILEHVNAIFDSLEVPTL